MIEIKNLCHSFGEHKLYENVNLFIGKEDKIGLVGENGTGKSTLINILSEQILCDKGSIVFDKKHKIGYLDQFANITPNITVYEYLKTAFQNLINIETEYININNKLALPTCNDEIDKLVNQSNNLLNTLLDNDFYEIDTKINKIATGLGIIAFGMDTIINNLSGGQRVKLMLAKLLLEEPDFLILDEPTNFLDTNHIDWFTKFLQSYKKSFLVISHDISFLNSIVNKIWAIDLHTISPYNGNYEYYVRLKNERIAEHNKNVDKQQVVEDKLKLYIAKNGVRTATASQAKSREKVLIKLQENKLEKIEPTPPPNFSFKYKKLINNPSMTIKNLDIGYGKKIIAKNISFTMTNNSKVQVSGFNGIGKTTLFKTILGQIEKLSGEININRNVVFGYYEQDHKFYSDEHTAIDEVLIYYPKMSNKDIRSALAKAGLSAKKQLQKIKTLSGGEQCKIQLCLISLTPCNVLLLDEPTNHLDLKTKQKLAEGINNFLGAVIFVSHEEEFAKLIQDCTKINLASYKK